MNPQVLEPLTTQPSEQRLLLDGVTWQQYEMMLALLGDNFPNLRLSRNNVNSQPPLIAS
jgi:hypothetical protein